MACGTPVLATPVGSIPDIIRDGDTGFIMDNNSPTCIVENIIRVLENPDLEKIAIKAKKVTREKFSSKSTVQEWENIFGSR
jgi:glycosyltransferase involved in cell wall biosynthesis